jgi:hypothetical protein
LHFFLSITLLHEMLLTLALLDLVIMAVPGLLKSTKLATTASLVIMGKMARRVYDKMRLLNTGIR